MTDFLLHFVQYTIGYTIGFIIPYLFLGKLLKNCALVNYINSKRSRGIISIFVIWGAFLLISLIVSMFNLSKNSSNIFLGLSIGVMVLLMSNIKYSKIS